MGTLILCLLLLIILSQTAWFVYFGLKSKDLARTTEHKNLYENTGAVKKILMIGDSMISGVGASNPHNSLPGKIASHYQHLQVTTDSIDGGKINTVTSLLKKIPAGETYDSIIIFSGGMDVIHHTPVKHFQQHLEEVFSLAQKHTKQSIYISPPNVGLAPIFIPPLSFLFSLRTKKLRRIVVEIAKKYNVIHLDLYQKHKDDYLKGDTKLYANDLSHPNDHGYTIWFQALKPSLDTLLK